MSAIAVNPEYWKLAAATLVLVAVILAALLAPAKLVAEERPPNSPDVAAHDQGSGPGQPNDFYHDYHATLSVDQSQVGECGCKKNVTVTVTLSRFVYPGDVVLVPLTISSDSTASRGSDYRVAASGNLFYSVTVPTGHYRGTVEVPFTFIEDTVAEETETIIIDQASTKITSTPATISILDNDPDLILEVNPVAISEEDKATEVTIRAILKTANVIDTAIDVTIQPLTGTADNPGDYTATTPLPTITIPAGQTTGAGTMTITPVRDAILEYDETIIVSGTTNRSFPGTNRAMTVAPVTIPFQDGAASEVSCGTYDITLSVSPDTVSEGDVDKDVTITATRTGTTGKATVAYSFQGTANADLANRDYSWGGEFPELSIADGDTSGSITMKFRGASNDTEYEGPETIVVSGTAPGKTVSEAFITVTDDDSYKSSGENITFTFDTKTINEDDEATVVNVVANREGSQGVLTVNVSVTGLTATEDDDYTVTGSTKITIPNESSSGHTALTITPVDDDIHEGNEIIRVSGTSGSLTAGTADIVIVDNDYYSIKPGTPTVTRTRFDQPTDKAGLDATWPAPTGGDDAITNYEVRHCKQGDSLWAHHGSTASRTDRTASIKLLDLGAVYHVQARALKDGKPHGGWSGVGSGQTNRAPRTTGATIPAGWKSYWWVLQSYDVATHFTDDDGDSLTYAARSEHPGIVVTHIWNEPQPKPGRFFIDPWNPSVESSKVHYWVHDGYGGRSKALSHSINQITGEILKVPENSPAGTEVGQVAGRPYVGDTDGYTYSLAGEVETSGLFEIDRSTGRITVKTGATLDYESEKNTYTGKVEWSVYEPGPGGENPKEIPVAANLTINVTDVTPGRPGTPTVTRTEFSEPSAPALDVAWTAAEANGTTLTGYEAQYRVKVAEDEKENAWTDYTYLTDPNDPATETNTLSVTTTGFTLPDLTPGTTYEFQVRAVSSDEGEGSWSDIGEGTANSPPQICCFAKEHDQSYFTGIPYGAHRTRHLQTNAGVHFITDPDNDPLTYEASARYPGILSQVNAYFKDSDGVAVMAHLGLNPAASPIDFTVRDAYGGVAKDWLLVTVITDSVRTIRENSPPGTNVGAPLVGNTYDLDGDEEPDETYTYRLTGEAATSGMFKVDSATGQISVKQGASLDHETKTSYTGKVEFTVQGQQAEINFTINVTDVTGPATPGAPSVSRPSGGSRTALRVSWTAPNDYGSPITDYDVKYSRGASGDWNNHSFSGVGTSTTISGLRSGTSYQVQVRARNAEGWSSWSPAGQGSTRSRPDRDDPPDRPDPTPEPTPETTPGPTPNPTPGPTPEPTPGSTPTLSGTPTPPAATPGPTLPPSATHVPTPQPTPQLTPQPTRRPGDNDNRPGSGTPTPQPTPSVTPGPTAGPTPGPTTGPTPAPTTPPGDGNPTPAPSGDDNPPDSTPPPGGDTDPGSTDGTDDSGSTSQLGGPPSQPKLAEGQTLSGQQQPPAAPAAFTSPRRLLSALPVRSLGSVTLPQEIAGLAGGTPGPASAAPAGDGSGMGNDNGLAQSSRATTLTTTTTTTSGAGSTGQSTETQTNGGAAGSSIWERVNSDYGLSSPWPWLFLLLALVAALSWLWIKRVRERWIRQRWA